MIAGSVTVKALGRLAPQLIVGKNDKVIVRVHLQDVILSLPEAIKIVRHDVRVVPDGVTVAQGTLVPFV